MSWYEESVCYQIYPLGLTGAPFENDHKLEHRLPKLLDGGWMQHLQKLGVSCVLLNPVFQSGTHGYDTIDFLRVDERLGTNDDLRAVVDACHQAGMKVLLDTVFNHVGREFWAFKDVLEKGPQSSYANWFCINWDDESPYGDGFAYECWEGVSELVKLNHHDHSLNGYCADVVRTWEREFDIDGLRLDVAYCLDRGFLGYLRSVTNELTGKRGQKFLMLGETMFGDYNLWMGDGACDTVTNYECYKGLWSSMNEGNMHEIAYALKRQSGSDPWDLYTGKHLLNFLDNHDVARIATQLKDKRHLKPLYGLLFGMCGVPCIYYGSEWGMEGEKRPGDRELRPAVERPEWNDLTDWIACLAAAKRASKALTHGSYQQVDVRPTALAFLRECEDERVLVAVNAGNEPVTFPTDALAPATTGAVLATDMLTGDSCECAATVEAQPFSCRFWKSAE